MEKQERISLKDSSKLLCKGHYGHLFIVTALVFLFNAVANIGEAPVSFLARCAADNDVSIETMKWIGGIVSALISPMIILGTNYVYLHLLDKKEVKASLLFEGFSEFVKAFCLGLLMAIFTFLWCLLLIVPGIIKAISYSQSFLILADHPEMKASEALEESKRLMKGHKWEYVVLNLSFLGWGILTLLTLGILSIYTTPYYQSTLTGYYRMLKEKATVKPVATSEAK